MSPTISGLFELIAGERRLRACKMLGLETVPAVIREIDNQGAAEWSLIENLQREDLNPIDTATAIEALIQQHALTHDEVASRIGMSRSAVTNALRLLELDAEIVEMLRRGSLSNGHGKVLLGVSDASHRIPAAKRAEREGWSVRRLEEHVRALNEGRPPQRSLPSKSERPRSAHARELEEALSVHLGTRVLLREGRRKGTGKMIIEFYSLEEFDGLLDRLGYTAES